MYRFAVRGRWLVGHFVVLAIAVLFVWLGLWQLHKATATRDRNETIRAREAMAPTDLGDLVVGRRVEDDALYRRVTITGHFEPTPQFVVLFRTLDEEPGAYLLTPIVTSDGMTVIVNRGWFGSQEAMPTPPAGSNPPPGDVRITGLLLPGERRTRTFGSSPGQPVELTTIDLAAVKSSVPSATAPAYVQLEQQDPAPPGALRTLPPPDLSSGPYFSYAVQWFLFTAVGLAGWPLLIRRAARERGALS